MRPRYLEIEGLQSFKEVQFVDFDKLGETGLFGIFGPTGSGKSTILDAITLALYGNVQRATRGTQGIVNTGMNTVKVKFTFDLLKNSERRTYRVERMYRRKKSSDNSVEIKVARLCEIVEDEDIILADKPGEVNQKVIELIGLQDDDFTRSVVLPQNKFQEFLFMDKSKKRDMMERIFYLEDYGRNLTEKVGKKLASVRYRLSGIEGAISALGELSEKVLLEVESNMQKAREFRETIDTRLKIAEISFNEAREVWDLTCDLAVITGREEKYLLQQPDVDRKRQEVDKAVKAAEMEQLIEKYLEIEKSLDLTNQQLDKFYIQMSEVSKAQDNAKMEQETFVKESEQQKPVLIERKTKLNEALSIAAELQVLEEQLLELREEYKKLRVQLDKHIQEMEAGKLNIENAENSLNAIRHQMESMGVDPDYRQQVEECRKIEENIGNLKKERDTCNLRFEDLSKRVHVVENQLLKLEVERLRQENKLSEIDKKLIDLEENAPEKRESLMEEGEVYHRLKAACETLKLIKRDIDTYYTNMKELGGKVERLKNTMYEQEEKKKEIADECMKAKKKLLDLEGQKEHNIAAILVKSLKEGAPCPVCGSMEHPLPGCGVADDEDITLNERLEQARANYEQAEKDFRKAEADCIKLSEQLRNDLHQYGRLQEELEAKQKEYAAVGDSLPDDIKNMQVDGLTVHIDNLNRYRAEKLQKLGDWEKEISETESNRLKIQQLLAEQKAEEASRRAELSVNRENLDAIKKDIEKLDSKIIDSSEQCFALLKALGIESAVQEMARMDSNQRKVLMLQKQSEEVEKVIKDLRNRMEKLERERQVLSEELYEVDARGREIRARKEEGDKKLLKIAAGKNVKTELTETEIKLSEIERRDREVHAAVREMESQFHACSSQIQMLENQKEIYTRDFKIESDRLNTALKEKGFRSIEEAKSHILSLEEIGKLKTDVDKFQEAVNNIQAHKHLIKSKLNERSITEEQWEIVQNEYMELKKQKDASISSFENAKSSYINYKKNFEQWIVLDKERQKLTRKKEILEQIQRLLKGNSFIEFISEERLRYIAKEASDTLGILTKYRYSLELDTDNGFVIRDNSNGGVHRLVSSLSGGETFLTSLSLALALSSQIQLKGQCPLEFFFLDEGFGTLDEELLNTVIDSMERLSSTKKVIGLISHVPELRNRIPRRLIIEPPSSNGKGSIVRLEKA